MNSNRRDFIRKATLGGAGIAIAPSLFASKAAGNNDFSAPRKIRFEQGQTILFQGDSITDAGRKKDSKDANNAAALGSGYAFLTTADILEDHASKDLKIYNRGISGNKVYQLAERWDADCLDLKPDVLSILIGVNDFWHTLTGGYKGTITTYNDDYRKLLDRTMKGLPNVKLVICEPFAVTGIKAVNEKWYPAFDEYRATARQIAKDYNALFVPYQSVFDKAQKKATGSYWTGDGVHPSIAGAELMAEGWLDVVGG